MSSEPVVRIDRRHRRREETIEQVLDVAVEAMGEYGAAGLSLSEVARRMGIRTPSLYGYFDSKNALYDAVFERGWRELLHALEHLATLPADDGALADHVLQFGAGFVQWAIEHPAYSQLLFWRPVPGYEPSPAAYAPAVEVLERARGIFVALQERGALRPDVDIDEAFRLWTVLISGVVSQQLSNAPHEPFEGGSFTSALPQLVAMFLTYFGAQPGPQSKGRRPHAGKSRSDR
jgi:AcrR family transcriptional regulator